MKERETVSPFPAIYHDRFCDRFLLFRSNWALWLPKTNAGSPAIFCDELNAGLFEGGGYCDHSILRHPDAGIGFGPLDGRNGYTRSSCDLGLRPSDQCPRSTNLRRAKQNA
jgi:hypothetical protein